MELERRGRRRGRDEAVCTKCSQQHPFQHAFRYRECNAQRYAIVNAVQHREQHPFRDAKLYGFEYTKLDAQPVVHAVKYAYTDAQPHRVKYIRQALEYVLSHTNVWQATAAEIAEYYLEQHYDRMMTYLGSRPVAKATGE